MMDHQETAADGVYRMILYNLLCFASVPVFIFGRQARKVTGINYQNPIMESCHGQVPKSQTSFLSSATYLKKIYSNFINSQNYQLRTPSNTLRIRHHKPPTNSNIQTTHASQSLQITLLSLKQTNAKLTRSFSTFIKIHQPNFKAFCTQTNIQTRTIFTKARQTPTVLFHSTTPNLTTKTRYHFNRFNIINQEPS